MESVGIPGPRRDPLRLEGWLPYTGRFADAAPCPHVLRL